jgi:hypothetical protein
MQSKKKYIKEITSALIFWNGNHRYFQIKQCGFRDPEIKTNNTFKTLFQLGTTKLIII